MRILKVFLFNNNKNLSKFDSSTETYDEKYFYN